jgi:hypothetical protein
VNVRDNKLRMTLSDICEEASDDKRLSSEVDEYSVISLKKSDSILHISIGNSSKIMKRNKRKRRWLFYKLYKLSRHKKVARRNSELIFNPHRKDNDVVHINNDDVVDGVNIINDNIVIKINNNRYNVCNGTSSEIDMRRNRQLKNLETDLDYGANELDFYMNELKKREIG